MKKHVNIPIFVPHMGCPHACVFCNQRTISGHDKPDFTKVRGEIENALKSVDNEKQEAQIAFFGGSFTGIERKDMIFLLSVAKEFIDDGRVSSIRISTRPDYIDEEIIEILKKYGVKSVELGIQSCSDRVLGVCERGHDRETSVKAGRMIVDAGLELVGQMMIGLPSSSADDEKETARAIVDMGAKAARIYPTVVFCGTELARMAERGEYTPLSRDDAVERSEEAFEIFVDSGVDVIRIGLQSSEALCAGEEIACGEYCEAIGEMVISRYFEKRLTEKFDGVCGGDAVIKVNPRRVSNAAGYHAETKKKLKEKHKLKSLKIIGDATLDEFEIVIKTNV